MSLRPPAPAPADLRVLGIDTALRSTGAAVVQYRRGVLETVEYTVIRNPATRPVSRCLAHLAESVADITARLRPHAAVLEGIFFCRNVKTALALGQARGAVIAACAAAAVPVFEYSPRRVKQAVVGYGAAGKEQVRRMVMALLRLDETPQEDAADALAIAVCHLHAAVRWGGAVTAAPEI